MTDLIEVKTARLIGVALDWAVTKAAGLEDTAKLVFPAIIDERNQPCMVTPPWSAWSPSTDWSQGGPLIEKYQVALVPEAHDGKEGTESSERWYADVYYKGGEQYTTEHCDTALIAACQAIVATEFGDTVQVPKELCQ